VPDDAPLSCEDLLLDQSRNPASRLTPEGQQALGEICRRQGVGEETALVLLDALSRTNGTMAQFNLPELGGSGQWMSGGMVMVGDMFNQGLKFRVDSLCYELAALLSSGPFRPLPGPSGGGTAGHGWPAALGTPNWQGSQNTLRYAYFAGTNRLALDVNGAVTVYDTTGFTLTGVSQQQSSGYGAILTFTGPGGIVTLDRLRRVEGDPDRPSPPAPAERPEAFPEAAPAAGPGDALDDRLAGTRWLYAPPAGAAAIPVTLGAEGVLVGADDQATRYWAVEEAALWFYAADGRATARFDRLIREAEGVQIIGTSPPGSGTPVALRALTSRPAAPATPSTPGPTVLALRLDLCDHDWAFGEKAGNPIATLRLLRDGTLSGSVRPTESSWRLEGDQLVLLHKSGRPTTRFTTLLVRDGRWTLSGPSLANDRIIFELSQA